jgi:hypothetical protein
VKRIIIFSLIFFLVLSTSLIKNSTKKIDDEIFIIGENLIFLEKRLKNEKLEHNYLSSSKKLLEYQNLFFENFLTKKSIKEIKSLNFSNEKLIIKNLEIVGKNEK